MNLEYYDGKNEVPEGTLRISPSQIAKFFNTPALWYRNVILGEDKFVGSTSSVLGTVVHGCAEAYVLNGEISEADESAIDAYILKEAGANYDIEPDVIRTHWMPMFKALQRDFLEENKPSNVEDFLVETVAPGVMVGGSCDYFDKANKVVLDYKTTSSLSAPTKIPWNYKIQALAYAWLYREAGYEVDKISICYITRNNIGRISEKTQRPMQDYPSDATVITEMITRDDWKSIENVIQIMHETITLHRTHPEYIHLLYKSMSLKQEPAPAQFPL